MEIRKAHWTSEGDNVRLAMPLSKVDVENRIVSGFASLDNADTQGDVILKEANKRAFERFRGNIREMHQPIAVGRMVAFKEDEFYDSKTEKFYNGIWVDVHVSKGAEDTWQKVLDGTLQGFSIGGSVIDAETQWVKDSNSAVRFVKDYELVELSLVDSPANQLANVFSITKVSGGDDVVTGMIADMKSENVFYCEKADCEIAKTSSEDALKCSNGHDMKTIGWFEYEGDEAVKTEKVRSIVAQHLAEDSIEKQVRPAENEGGVNVADVTETDGQAAEKDGDILAGEQGKAETEVEASVEEEGTSDAKEEVAVEAADTEDEAGELEKALDVFSAKLEEGLEKNRTALTEALDGLTEKFEGFRAGVEEKVNELDSKANDLTEKLAGLNETLGKMEKSVEALEGETAIKKSGDLGGSQETELKKSSGLWSNAIL